MISLLLTGLLFVIGSIIDEAQGNHDQNNYISARKCCRARKILVLKWTVLGFLLTISYKSVLRSMMMKVEYEDTIDTIDDLLESDRILLIAGDSGLKLRFEGDPREKVRKLANKTQYVNFNLGASWEVPRLVIEG